MAKHITNFEISNNFTDEEKIDAIVKICHEWYFDSVYKACRAITKDASLIDDKMILTIKVDIKKEKLEEKAYDFLLYEYSGVKDEWWGGFDDGEFVVGEIYDCCKKNGEYELYAYKAVDANSKEDLYYVNGILIITINFNFYYHAWCRCYSYSDEESKEMYEHGKRPWDLKNEDDGINEVFWGDDD